jgi:hypothetical protein
MNDRERRHPCRHVGRIRGKIAGKDAGAPSAGSREAGSSLLNCMMSRNRWERSTFNAQRSTLNVQPETINLSTINRFRQVKAAANELSLEGEPARCTAGAGSKSVGPLEL